LYNAAFFNDGYHVEHHTHPWVHWYCLPQVASDAAAASRWPAVLRWLEAANLERMERVALHMPAVQKLLLCTHERALRRHLPRIRFASSVLIVGGGLFPRSAILLRQLLPHARIRIMDASADNIAAARPFVDEEIQFINSIFDGNSCQTADLIVIPLAYIGDRAALYSNPPAPAVLIHDWIWSKRGDSVIVSRWLLKRLNLIHESNR
jgi:hypothetical protein